MTEATDAAELLGDNTTDFVVEETSVPAPPLLRSPLPRSPSS